MRMKGAVSLGGEGRVMRGRGRMRRVLCAAVVASCAIAWTATPLTLALAQTGSESPNTLPDTKIAPAPGEESSSPAAAPERPAAAPSEGDMAAPEVPPPSPVHHKTHHRSANPALATVSATQASPAHTHT